MCLETGVDLSNSFGFICLCFISVAASTLVISSFLIFLISKEIEPDGFVIKSTAPLVIASTVLLAPNPVTLASIITGYGWVSIIFLKLLCHPSLAFQHLK